jgi:hypothetical protein
MDLLRSQDATSQRTQLTSAPQSTCKTFDGSVMASQPRNGYLELRVWIACVNFISVLSFLLLPWRVRNMCCGTNFVMCSMFGIPVSWGLPA